MNLMCQLFQAKNSLSKMVQILSESWHLPQLELVIHYWLKLVQEVVAKVDEGVQYLDEQLGAVMARIVDREDLEGGCDARNAATFFDNDEDSVCEEEFWDAEEGEEEERKDH